VPVANRFWTIRDSQLLRRVAGLVALTVAAAVFLVFLVKSNDVLGDATKLPGRRGAAERRASAVRAQSGRSRHPSMEWARLPVPAFHRGHLATARGARAVGHRSVVDRFGSRARLGDLDDVAGPPARHVGPRDLSRGSHGVDARRR